jgi:glycosyltransferase involved in cell wall biosynthesis
MKAAPIALFVYNRLAHLRRAAEALADNVGADNSDLIVFSDGPKDNAARDALAAVRRYIRTLHGFQSVTIVERDKNLGLAQSIIQGVTEVLGEHDRVIVLEDDLLTSPFFLRFMNEALEWYRDDERVASIHAYVFPVERALPETFFLRGADCWGWACWRRSWRLFNPDSRQLLAELRRRGLTRPFDLDGAYGFSRMLEDQIAGANDSWAVRWHASVFLREKLTLYPGRSLVYNIGNDRSGRHGGDTGMFDVELATTPIRVGDVPVEESQAGRAAFINFMRQRASWRHPLRLLSGMMRRLRKRA